MSKLSKEFIAEAMIRRKDMKKYKIYRNITCKMLSIQDKNTGLVVGHCSTILLKNAVFRVNEAGIKRIRKNNVKEVIAVAIGNINRLTGFVPYKSRNVIANVNWTAKIINGENKGWDGEPLKEPDKWENFHFVTFNPYKHKSFIYKESKKKIAKAGWCYITAGGLMLTNE